MVVAGTEVVELNFLNGYLLWLRENVCIPYQQFMQAIKYLIVHWYSMTADFKLILVSVLDVKFYYCYQPDISIATRLFEILLCVANPRCYVKTFQFLWQ